MGKSSFRNLTVIELDMDNLEGIKENLDLSENRKELFFNIFP